MIDIKAIWKTIPHRYPLLLVDRVLEMRGREYIHAIKNVTINETFFNGHFPGEPIMPGVLIIEALAQAGAVLALYEEEQESLDESRLLLFRGIDKAKFRRTVVPGDQLHTTVSIDKKIGNTSIVKARVSVDGEQVARGELMFSAAPA